jgi:hypothetical protein
MEAVARGGIPIPVSADDRSISVSPGLAIDATMG